MDRNLNTGLAGYDSVYKVVDSALVYLTTRRSTYACLVVQPVHSTRYGYRLMM